MKNVKKMDTILVPVGKTLGWVECFSGQREYFLGALAQKHAEAMAASDLVTHNGWIQRRGRIVRKMGLASWEVVGVSRNCHRVQWEAALDMYDQWLYGDPMCSRRLCIVAENESRRTLGRRHDFYGDGMARSKSGLWYGCVIVGDPIEDWCV